MARPPAAVGKTRTQGELGQHSGYMVRVTHVANALQLAEQAGPWAVVLYALLFVAANVAFVPASVLTLAGGCALGFWPAALVVAVSRPTAAVVGFGLARRLLRGWVSSKIAGRTRLMALDRALSQDTLRVVMLLRLSPVLPSTLSNYALGASGVPLRPFAVGSALGTLPSTLLYAYLGSGIRELTRALSGARGRHPAEYALWGLGLLATFTVVLWLSRAARDELSRLSAPS